MHARYMCQGIGERRECLNGGKEREEWPREGNEGQDVSELRDRNVGGGWARMWD